MSYRSVLWTLSVVLLGSPFATAGEILLQLDLSKPPNACDASELKQTITGVRGPANFVQTDDGNAYWLDGLTDQLAVEPSDELRDALAQPFTIELSFLFHVLPTQTQSYPCMVAALDEQGKYVWALRGYKYNDWCQFHVAPKASLTLRRSAKAMDWHHAAVCFTGEQLVGYLDGVQMRERVTWSGLEQRFSKIVLGQRGHSKWDRFSGLIKGFKISRGVLYGSETSQAAKLANAERLREKSLEKFAELMKPEDPAWERHHPFMLFTSDQIPALKARLRVRRGPELLRHFRQDCDDAIDPKSPRYVAPDTRLGLFQDRYWPGCNQALLPLASILFDDEKYVRHGIELMLTTARTVGYYDIAEKGDASFAGAAGTVMTLALGYDWAYRWMTPEQRRAVRECLLELGAAEFEVSMEKGFRLFWVRNWNAMGISALGHASLAVMGETLAPAHEWLHAAKRLTEEYFNNAVGRDGGFLEGPAYFYYGTHQLLIFAAALAHSTQYNLFETTNLKRLPDYLCYCLAPWGGEIDPVGYCGPKISHNMHALAVLRDWVPGKPIEWLWRRSYGDDPYRWLNMQYYLLPWYRPQPEVSTPELPLAQHFRDRGIVKMRTGWDADALAASFEAEWARTAAHDQADRGNFTINGYGGRWCVDAGGRNTPNSGSTRAHNLVTIDGKGQAHFYQNSNSDAFITDYCHLDRLATTVEADLTNAYCYGRSWHLVRRDVNEFRHVRRRFTMVRGDGDVPPYFIVMDDIDKDGEPHDYIWHLHSLGLNEAKLTDSGALSVTKNWPSEVSYLVHPKPAGVRAGPVPHAQKYGRAELDINVPEDGTYKLWGLGRAGDECPGGMDSWFLSLGNRENIYWSGGWDMYYKWLAVPGTFDLSKGKHTLVVRMREPEARVVRFYLTKQLDMAPVGWIPPAGVDRIVIEASKPTRLTPPMATAVEQLTSQPGGMDVVPLWPPDAKPHLGTFAPDVTCTQILYTLSVRTENPRFATLIYPRKPGMPKLEVQRRDRHFVLDWGGTVDRVYIRTDRPIRGAGISSDAWLVVMRAPARATPETRLRYFMAGGSSLTSSGKVMVDLVGQEGTAMVADEGACVNGERVRTFRVFAPHAKSVLAFGELVEFRKIDGMVCPAAGSVKAPPVLRWGR